MAVTLHSYAIFTYFYLVVVLVGLQAHCLEMAENAFKWHTFGLCGSGRRKVKFKCDKGERPEWLAPLEE